MTLRSSAKVRAYNRVLSHIVTMPMKLWLKAKDSLMRPNYSIFEGIVRNSWLGLTYLALEKLHQSSGSSHIMAIEVALKVDD